MTREQVTQAIHEILGRGFISFSDTQITVEPPSGMYATWQVDYDDLRRLSVALGTRAISFRHDSGWGGSEDTPGDPATLRLVIDLVVPA